jgi:chaperonin GroES
MSSKVNIKPLGDRVVIEIINDDDKSGKTKSGIIIPETVDKERPEQGKIIAVGEGRTTDDGQVIPLKVKKGQTVIFSKYGPDEIKVNDREYLIVSESNILAIIE